MQKIFFKFFLAITFFLSHAEAAKNLVVSNCSSFPYYGDPKSSSSRLIKSVDEGFEDLYRCLSRDNISPQIKKKVFELSEILNSNLIKTLKCSYGETYSYYAKASLKNTKVKNLEEMPPYPSIVFDTNRIAGNFPLKMTHQEIINFSEFYNIPLEEIKPGTRNHHHTRVNNPTALVAHEMLHWTGLAHKSNKLDLIYLSQMCCFKIKGVSAGVNQAACKIIEDSAAWQVDLAKRKKHISEMGYLRMNREIIDAYHNQ